MTIEELTCCTNTHNSRLKILMMGSSAAGKNHRHQRWKWPWAQLLDPPWKCDTSINRMLLLLVILISNLQISYGKVSYAD